MANITKKKPTIKVKKLTAEEQAERELARYWEEVDQLAQPKIYQLLINNLPLPGLKLITHGYDYTEQHQSLTGLFLHKDTDYRTILIELEDKYYEEALPSQEYLAEEITLNYCHILIKNIITNVSEYSSYCPSYFENLTEN